MGVLQAVMASMKIAAGGGDPTYNEIASDSFGGTLGNFTATNIDIGGSTSINTGVVVSSAAITLAGDGGASNVWSGSGTFDNWQRSKVTITTDFLSNAYYSGAIVQATTDTNTNRDYYGGVVEHDSGGAKTTRLFKVINGTYTSLATASVSWVNGDELWLDFDPATEELTMWREGTRITGLIDIPVGGTALSGGKPGFIVSSGGSTTAAIDNFSGGDLS